MPFEHHTHPLDIGRAVTDRIAEQTCSKDQLTCRALVVTSCGSMRSLHSLAPSDSIGARFAQPPPAGSHRSTFWRPTMGYSSSWPFPVCDRTKWRSCLNRVV